MGAIMVPADTVMVAPEAMDVTSEATDMGVMEATVTRDQDIPTATEGLPTDIGVTATGHLIATWADVTATGPGTAITITADQATVTTEAATTITAAATAALRATALLPVTALLLATALELAITAVVPLTKPRLNAF